MEDKKNNLRNAAALKYDPATDSAPILTAAGRGAVAENILKTAEIHGVPIVKDTSVAELLTHFSVGDVIPPILYEAVAQVLLFVAETDQKASEKFRQPIR